MYFIIFPYYPFDICRIVEMSPLIPNSGKICILIICFSSSVWLEVYHIYSSKWIDRFTYESKYWLLPWFSLWSLLKLSIFIYRNVWCILGLFSYVFSSLLKRKLVSLVWGFLKMSNIGIYLCKCPSKYYACGILPTYI